MAYYLLPVRPIKGNTAPEPRCWPLADCAFISLNWFSSSLCWSRFPDGLAFPHPTPSQPEWGESAAPSLENPLYQNDRCERCRNGNGLRVHYLIRAWLFGRRKLQTAGSCRNTANLSGPNLKTTCVPPYCCTNPYARGNTVTFELGIMTQWFSKWGPWRTARWPSTKIDLNLGRNFTLHYNFTLQRYLHCFKNHFHEISLYWGEHGVCLQSLMEPLHIYIFTYLRLKGV